MYFSCQFCCVIGPTSNRQLVYVSNSDETFLPLSAVAAPGRATTRSHVSVSRAAPRSAGVHHAPPHAPQTAPETGREGCRFFSRVLHTICCHIRAHAFVSSVTMVRFSDEQGSSSSRQQRRWAIDCGSPQSQLTECVLSM